MQWRGRLGVVVGLGLMASVSGAPAQSQALGTVVERPEYNGFLELTAQGNGGGSYRVRYDYRGFYVASLPVLSGAIDAGMAPLPGLKDAFILMPMHAQVSVTASLKDSTSFEGRNRTDCWLTTVAASANERLAIPDRETVEAILLRGGQGGEGMLVPPIIIEDRRKAGGNVTLASWQATDFSFGPNRVAAHATQTRYDGPGSVSDSEHGEASFGYFWYLGAPGARQEVDVGWAGDSGFANTQLEHSAPIVLPNDFSLEHLAFDGVVEERYSTPGRACSYLEDDTEYVQRARFSIGIPDEAVGSIAPADPAESEWMPSYGDLREFTVTLDDPNEVTGLRVSLLGTSSHAGVATNAGNHTIQAPTCRDCTRGLSVAWHGVSGHLGDVAYSRTYAGRNACPIDAQPDLFFRDSDNPDFTLVNPVSDELQYSIAQVIERSDISEKTYTIVVRVMDSGGSTRLGAEAQVAGNWKPLRAEGPTADAFGNALELPLDADGDNLADVWNTRHQVSGARGDIDPMPNPRAPGDGLSNFEEYRGIYESGLFTRLDPELKDVFVYDDTRVLFQEIEGTRGFYLPLGLAVHSIVGSEHLRDVVNYQRTDYSIGNQYTAAIMWNPAKPADVGYRAFADFWLSFAGLASVGPPRDGENTIAMQYRNVRRPTPAESIPVLSHELGHAMGILHHGESDDSVTFDAPVAGLPAGRYLVATPGGQHSGDFSCVMKYHVASLFCRSAPPTASSTVVPYVLPALGPLTLCRAKTGTGMNAADAWAGDATVGNCLAQLKVRSY